MAGNPGYPANRKAAWQPASEPPGKRIRIIGSFRADLGIKGCYPLNAPPDHLIVATVMEGNFRESSVRPERNSQRHDI
jgi:hypothetical protein